MKYLPNTFDPRDPRPHILLVPEDSAIIYRGMLIKPVISWLCENAGEKDKGWRLKRHYTGRGVLVKLTTEELALAFKLRWS